MLNIPEKIKDLFRADNISYSTIKKFKLIFYDEVVDTLYPYETLFPDESLFPSEHGEAWLVIENDQIESESLTITESLSESEDLEFGSCEAAVLEVTVADVIEDITGREFTLTIEIGGYEMAMGIYTVESFVRQADRRKRKITAYDRMRWFNTDVSSWYNDLTFPMTLKTFRDSLCEYIGIQQNQTNLLFDSMEITKTIEPSQMSGLDILKAICQINGCFGHVDKTGQLTYIHLQQTGLYPSEDLFPYEELYPSEFGGDGQPTEIVSTYKSMTYEDYLVDGITGLNIREQEGDIGASVGESDNVYAVEGNFLVYGKSAVELLNIAESLLPIISGRIYRPAAMECNAMPWVEVGDAIIIPTRDDVVETFAMSRVTKGCQAMMDSIESSGSKKREEVFGVNKQIIQLEGKSAILAKSVEEVSVKVTDLKQETEAQFKITSEQIQSEVTRATEAEGQLSTKITQTATEIRQEVTNTKNGLQSQITQNANAITLKVSKGDVTNQINSELKITGNSIALTTGHFTINAKNMTLDSDGNATFSGNVTGAAISGGTINIGNGVFQVDSSGKVVAKNINIDGVANQSTIGCKILSASTASLDKIQDCQTGYINDLNSNTIWCGGDVNCGEVYINKSWWEGWSVTSECQYLQDQINSLSDETVKENIKNLPEKTLELILKSRPVSFNYIEDKKESLGLIAQEVSQLQNEIGTSFPLVEMDDKYKKWRIAYQRYIPLLIKSIQLIYQELHMLKKGDHFENTNI